MGERSEDRADVRRTSAVVVWVAAWGFLISQACTPPPKDIIYDDAGRLKAVIDTTTDAGGVPVGEMATYAYDAVGNILGITRQPAGTLSLLEWMPPCAVPTAAPTTLTLYGTGFSATAGNNLVTVGGVGASVSSASLTTLVVVTTGRGQIVVQSPLGGPQVTSGLDTFGDCGAPTVTSLTPTIGLPGSVVGLTGTNFDPEPGGNRVTFNVSSLALAATAPTSMLGLVPGDATSGRVTVTTAVGTAISGQDFFVVPASFTAAQVEHTGRLTFGVGQELGVVTAGKALSLAVFEGMAGHRVSLQKTNDTLIDSTTGFVPTGAPVFSAGWDVDFMDPVALPVTGTYGLRVEPVGGAFTGTLTVTLWDVPDDLGGTVQLGGSTALTTTVPGQDGTLTLSATAGPITLSGTKPSNVCIGVHLLNPSGSELDWRLSCGATTSLASWSYTLPSAGGYAIAIDWYDAAIGTVQTTVTRP